MLSEEVNTEVAVLTSLSRGGDADDLARTALQDQQVTNADVVAWDGDGVWNRHVALLDGDAFSGVTWSRDGDFLVFDDDVFFLLDAVVVVVVLRAVNWV